MKRKAFWASLLLALSQFGFAADSAQQQVNALLAHLDSKDAPGAAVLVVKDGVVMFERGYGVTDLRTRQAIDPHTNFRLASVTKQFTAMAVMLLVHDGKLHYEDRVTDIFPDFPSYGRAITIRHLLNHTSGLADYEELMTAPDPNTPSENVLQIHDAAVLELLKQQKTTNFAPGTKWAYSNSGYVVLGVIVAKVSGIPFGDFMRQHIFAPLGMNSTIAYEKGKNEVAHRAYGYSRDGKGWKETDQSPTSATLGDGGVYSSLDDLAKWDAALRRHTLLSEAEMKPALTPANPPGGSAEEPDGSPAQYGFGWFLNPYRGHARMWHPGETMGFRTAVQRFIDEKLTVIVLCNRIDLEARDIALRIADVYLPGKPGQ